MNYDKNSKLLELINKLFVDNYENMKSCLIIFYMDSESDIYKSLCLLKYRKILNISSNEFDNIIIDNSNVEIILSDESGVGKSTYIKLEIEKSGKDYIYFPLGGVLNKEDILERLKNLEIEKKNPNKTVFYLDLYNTEQIGLMVEFLFSVLITKFYGKN